MVLSVDWRLAVAALTLGLIFVAIDVRFARPLRTVSDSIQDATAVGNRRLLETLTRALVVRLCGLAERKCAGYAEVMQSVREHGLRKLRLDVARSAVGSWQGWLTQAGMIGLGCVLVSRWEITLPDLLLAVGMLGQVICKMQLASGVLPGVQRSMAGAARAFAALDAEEEDARPNLAAPLPSGQTALELDRVTFRYPGGAEPALSEVCLRAARGQTVARVGGSGSGKTTVFRLLLGMPRTREPFACGVRNAVRLHCRHGDRGSHTSRRKRPSSTGAWTRSWC